MPLVDPSGRALPADTDEVWRVQALYEWISDERVGKLILRRRLCPRAELQAIFLALRTELKTRAQANARANTVGHTTINRRMLRHWMLGILRDPVVRRSIARLRAQTEIDDYNEAVAANPGKLVGKPRAMRPEGLHEIRAELQAEREELEVQEQAETLVWRPES